MLPVSIYLTPDGVEMIEGPGVTISDLRNQYPGCELIEVNHPAMSHNKIRLRSYLVFYTR